MEIEDREIQIFQHTLEEISPYDFSGYSLNSLRRRLSKIVDEMKTDVLKLCHDMRSDTRLVETIVKKITVNTTELFRDPQVWKQLRYEVLPRYARLPSIHIWQPGCSTGQEIYSTMMLLEDMGLLDKARIYGSDLNEDVLETARKGIYKYRFNKEYVDNFEKVFNLSADQTRTVRNIDHRKYFTIDETRDQIRMNSFLREKPVYAKIDLVKDQNLFFVNFDLIICRNVIIYFNYELQNRVIKTFHDNMHDRGCLLLGLHESILGPCSSYFAKDDFFYYKK